MVWKPCVSDCAMGMPLKTTSLSKSTPPLIRLLNVLPVTPGARKHELVDLAAAAAASSSSSGKCLHYRVFNE